MMRRKMRMRRVRVKGTRRWTSSMTLGEARLSVFEEARVSIDDVVVTKLSYLPHTLWLPT